VIRWGDDDLSFQVLALPLPVANKRLMVSLIPVKTFSIPGQFAFARSLVAMTGQDFLQNSEGTHALKIKRIGTVLAMP
jgi:hypothetical protein